MQTFFHEIFRNIRKDKRQSTAGGEVKARTAQGKPRTIRATFINT